MKDIVVPHIGMRKLKSILAVALVFVIWQVVRFFLPQLEHHPVFAYIYAIVEMRDSLEKTRSFGVLRIKATLVGLVVGIAFLSLSANLSSLTDVAAHHILIDFVLIMIATLVSLTLAEITKCGTFCGIAAIITVICIVSVEGNDRYLYAFMRVAQTLLGVFCAFVVNAGIPVKSSEAIIEEKQTQEEKK